MNANVWRNYSPGEMLEQLSKRAAESVAGAASAKIFSEIS